MTNTVSVFVAIKRRRFGRHVLVDLAIETARDVERRDPRFGRTINFHAIAGRKDDRFRAAEVAQQTLHFHIAAEMFERFDVGQMMTESNAEQIHGACDWALKVIPQSRVSAALNPIMQSAATRFGANQRK